MQRWVRGAPNGDNGADQTPPEDDLAAEDDVLGPTTRASRGGMMTGTGHVAVASDTLGAGINLDWLSEPERTQALSDRAGAYGDIGRCAYHTPPYGCTLVDGDADGPAEPARVPPGTRPNAVTQILGTRRMSAATGVDAATEVYANVQRT